MTRHAIESFRKSQTEEKKGKSVEEADSPKEKRNSCEDMNDIEIKVMSSQHIATI